MARKTIILNKCPLCGKEVELIAPGILMKDPGKHNAEVVVTKRGLTQYIHSSCWYKMIEEKRPYDGKLYM